MQESAVCSLRGRSTYLSSCPLVPVTDLRCHLNDCPIGGIPTRTWASPVQFNGTVGFYQLHCGADRLDRYINHRKTHLSPLVLNVCASLESSGELIRNMGGSGFTDRGREGEVTFKTGTHSNKVPKKTQHFGIGPSNT